MAVPPTPSLFSGTKDSFPLVLAAVPFGIIYGALGQSMGLDVILVTAISVFVYAGASQFIALSLLAAGAATPIIILTVFMVNLRHTLYSVSLLPLINKLKQTHRLWMGFTLTDETYAVVINEASQHATPPNITAYYLGSALFMYINWVACTVIGFYVGESFPQLTSFGLDVAMVVAFTGIVMSQLKLPSHWICASVAGVSGALTYHWPHQSGLLFSAVAAIYAGVYFENKLASSKLKGGQTS